MPNTFNPLLHTAQLGEMAKDMTELLTVLTDQAKEAEKAGLSVTIRAGTTYNQVGKVSDVPLSDLRLKISVPAISISPDGGEE